MTTMVFKFTWICVILFCTYFSEKSPPLPVPESQINSAVPLNHFHGCQLLLFLAECPVNLEVLETSNFSICDIFSHNLTTIAVNTVQEDSKVDGV